MRKNSKNYRIHKISDSSILHFPVENISFLNSENRLSKIEAKMLFKHLKPVFAEALENKLIVQQN